MLLISELVKVQCSGDQVRTVRDHGVVVVVFGCLEDAQREVRIIIVDQQVLSPSVGRYERHDDPDTHGVMVTCKMANIDPKVEIGVFGVRKVRHRARVFFAKQCLPDVPTSVEQQTVATQT